MEAETPQFVNEVLALWDEEEIEASALDLEIDQPHLEAFRQALRAIDKLKMSGRYDEEIAKLRRNLPEPRSQYYTDEARGFVRDVGNLMSGVRSPDPEQAASFRKLMDELELWEKVPGDVPKSLLAVLEPAKKRRGRKSAIVPWANEQQNMDLMRLAVASGQSVSDAARACAADAIERNVDQAERAKTLAKLYRKKMALRE